MPPTSSRFAPGAWLLAAAVLTAQSSGPIQQSGVSPRIQQLTDQVGRGQAAASGEFWAALARDHTPIVEAIPGDPGHVLVTFVWRSAEPASIRTAGRRREARLHRQD